MKKIVLLVAFCLSIGNVFAQDAEKLRDEGDAALKAKNYPEAVAKYGEYLKLTEYKDTVRIFNCGFSANQAKMYEEAAKYFDMAVKYNYNLDDSYTGEAMAYRNLNKTEEFVSLMEKRDFARLKKMLDEGFDPNSTYELEVGYSYDNGLIHGTETVERRLLDLVVCKNSPALQKLLRHYGGKTGKERPLFSDRFSGKSSQ